MKKTIAKYIYSFALGSTVFVFLFFLITNYLIALLTPNLLGTVAILLVAAVICGLGITTAISIFDPVLWEAAFVSRRLQRFESLSSPLLLRLSTEAPGTYHHSINVSNLAQQAAKSIGADSLLVRTAAYYHDIGKIAAPTLFIENQSGEEIPADLASDDIRVLANNIISHVENGVKIAREYNVPEEIIDLIAEHHGTTKAMYFYEKAKEQGLRIKKTDFRYAGPTPQSKEAAILMIADAVEATAKAAQHITAETISEIVENTIHDKISDNQLKNANLDEVELAKIKSSLEKSLLSIYHQRIEYKKAHENQL